MRKNSTVLVIALMLFIACGKNKDFRTIVSERLAVSDLNFIPDSAGSTPSYWCTWSAQNYAVDTFTLNYVIGLGDHTVPADNLTEEKIFRNPGWEKQMPGDIKKDLYITFDVGWDIAGGSHQDKDKIWIIGSQEVATDKFPSCTGTPAERLKKLNEMTKNAGWKGAAIWIAAQTAMDSKGKKPSDKEVEEYFRERFRWSKAAGIEYWKVDYGARGGDINFRKMLTRLAHEEAPGLWVEHGRGSGPFNDDECPWDDPNPGKTGMYKNWGKGTALETAHNLLQFSDVLRTYDVSAHLSVPTTLDRVAQILGSFSATPDGKGIINCEDEPYIAAALGCAIGIMRHPAFMDAPGHDYDPLRVKNQMDAVVRAVKWQRISPAFQVGSAQVNLDTAYNSDYWSFKPGETWAKWMYGKTVLQAAPARVSRGMDLPEVKGDTLPYVISSRFPNGNYAVATLFRTDTVKGFVYPLADVIINCDNAGKIGVFGNFKSLKINFAGNGFKQVFAQDLAGNKAIEITDLVKIKDNSILLDGELIKVTGTSAASKGDVSEPGVLLVFK
jgi:hypothetical protein